MPEEGRIVPSLLDYLQVVRRRRWTFVGALVLVPLVAVLLSLRGSAAYEASAQVLVHGQTPADLLGFGDRTLFDAERALETEAELARLPALADRVVTEAGVSGLSSEDFLDSSEVSASSTTDVLTFSVSHSSPSVAARLASEYAEQFADFRHEVDDQALARARQAIEAQIDQLRELGQENTRQYRSLVDRAQDLATIEAVQASLSVLPASAPEKVPSQAARNGMLGVALGLVLGLALAFLWEALDTRVRSVEKIRDRLGIPLLGRIPAPSRRARKKNQLVMMKAPTSRDAEAFRALRSSLDLANADHRAQTIMVTSAVGGEGKSTTAANLAVAFARSGRRVVLVDCDLRSPYLHRFFGLWQEPGLIDVELGDVELGEVELDEALQPVSVTGPGTSLADHGSRAALSPGKLELLPAGRMPSNPDALRVEIAFARVLEELRARADLVIIDAGPLLPVGDAAAVSAFVDALVVVVRRESLSSSTLDDLSDVLSSIPATKLGFVFTGDERRGTYKASGRHSVSDRRGPTRLPTVSSSERRAG